MPSLLIWALALSPAAGPVSFSRDILPILSDKCLACHGPDAAARKAGLRLDDSNAAQLEHGGMQMHRRPVANIALRKFPLKHLHLNRHIVFRVRRP
ncbi:MAG: hypothetical protein EBS01_08680 [Verrucomicrobia bacterium]|nr:hypothetical protein [Verrucomicrobiota bacterium]